MTVEAAGRRVEAVLDRLDAAGDPAAASAAEELVRALMDLYGEGLARIVALLPARDGAGLEPLLDDEVVAGLLVLHDLHPQDTAARIERALRRAGAASARVAGFDAASGELRIALSGGTGCGCPSSTAATRERIEAALSCFAPEATRVVFDPPPGAAEPVLLQIGARPAVAS
jgi:Fe-S cluster biogenesis protein NfuA